MAEHQLTILDKHSLGVADQAAEGVQQGGAIGGRSLHQAQFRQALHHLRPRGRALPHEGVVQAAQRQQRAPSGLADPIEALKKT